MRSLRLLAAISSAIFLTACLNSTTLVKVRPDGSGTVEQTTLVNMSAARGLGGQGRIETPMSSKADLERMAQSMGKGVRLVSTEPVKGERGFEGTKSTFAFDDINQIQISEGGAMSGGDRSGSPSKDDPVRFKLTRNGATSTLTIDIVDRPGGGKSDASPSTNQEMPDLTNPMIMNMMKTMFQGFKINVGLEVVGSIVKTNADYVSGSKLTILELDIASILADEAKLKALQGRLGPDASLSEVKPYLKDIKGIKIDGPSISVEFR